mmetsp:Transcript_50782/g.120675  ORF Transcript_50782/g.120675 Transcript_50782/m.120675 type:complete len:151 (+) Transcript_50782:154-606(+)
MFAALRSKSKDIHDASTDGRMFTQSGSTRSSSRGRRGSKGHHSAEYLQKKIATADEEIKHHLKCRSKCSAVHAIKKKQMYEKELAEVLAKEGGVGSNRLPKDENPEAEQARLEAEYVRMLSVDSPSIEYVDVNDEGQSEPPTASSITRVS